MVRITGFYVTCIACASDVYYEGVNFVDMIKFWDLTYQTPITCTLLIFLQFKEWSGKNVRSINFWRQYSHNIKDGLMIHS